MINGSFFGTEILHFTGILAAKIWCMGEGSVREAWETGQSYKTRSR
jgi:hypothetical protein